MRQVFKVQSENIGRVLTTPDLLVNPERVIYLSLSVPKAVPGKTLADNKENQ